LRWLIAHQKITMSLRENFLSFDVDDTRKLKQAYFQKSSNTASIHMYKPLFELLVSLISWVHTMSKGFLFLFVENKGLKKGAIGYQE
jgi:hypothetical protein